jgi:hypothetical protein
MLKQSICAVLFASLIPGCVADADQQGDVEIEGTGSDPSYDPFFAANWNYSWGDTKYSFADIGTAVNRACFMSGVAGYLTTNKFPEGTSQADAGLHVNTSTNHWELAVAPAITGTLGTWARCVDSTTLTAEVTWRSDLGRKVIAPATAARRCFLTHLTTGRDSLNAHGGFQASSDRVTIYSDGVNWYLDGNQSGLVWASARCIDVTQDLGEIPGSAPAGATNTTQLVAATNGATCMLTEVTGKLTALNDWENGPFVNYNAATNYFELKTKNDTGARVRCAR